MSNIVDPKDTSGGRAEKRVVDDDVQELLRELLKEQKKMNLYLSMITDIYLKDAEVE